MDPRPSTRSGIVPTWSKPRSAMRGNRFHANLAPARTRWRPSLSAYRAEIPTRSQPKIRSAVGRSVNAVSRRTTAKTQMRTFPLEFVDATSPNVNVHIKMKRRIVRIGRSFMLGMRKNWLRGFEFVVVQYLNTPFPLCHTNNTFGREGQQLAKQSNIN
jgi:hypothetical protein